MKVVVDTNILVSGLLNPLSAPGQIVRWVADGILIPCHDARVLAEYEEVLRRPKFDFSPDEIRALLAQIQAGGLVMSGQLLAEKLPDPDDEMFLEIALASNCEFLITGNARDYPAGTYGTTAIIAPAAFVADRLKEGFGGGR